MSATYEQQVVETVARAICRAYFYCDLDKPDGIAHWQREQARCRLEARAAIAAYRSITDTAPAPATCETCDGRREVGWFDRGEDAWHTEPCPDCTAPAPAISGGEALNEAGLRAAIDAVTQAHENGDDWDVQTEIAIKAYLAACGGHNG